MKKIKVALLYGGPSDEYAVSVKTAHEVAFNLSTDKYSVTRVHISKTGKWPAGVNPASLKKNSDVAFIAMHGAYGEDGTIQALLESVRMPYTGSGVMASSLAMDKFRSGLVAQAIGLTVPKTWLVGTSVILESALPREMIIKPNTGGSSVGVSVVSKSTIIKDLKKFTRKYKGYVIQEKVAGTEVTVPVLGEAPLPVVEIVSTNQLYDYEAKYMVGKSDHIIPARLAEATQRSLGQAALLIHRMIGCGTMSRTDFIVSKNKMYYLETNTIPGMTSTSLLPQSAAVAGISFAKLLDTIIISAVQ